MIFKSERQKIGQAGEESACQFLKNKGFFVVCRNYQRPWGEIDIVAERDGIVHFVEVKSVTREKPINSVSRENEDFSPEGNVNYWKRRSLRKIIETYILDKDLEKDWIFDVVCVYLDKELKPTFIDFLEDTEL